MFASDLLAGFAARVASTDQLDELVGATLHEIAQVGFGAVWIAILDEATGKLVTLTPPLDVGNGVRTARAGDGEDPRLPLGRGFQERRLLHIPEAGPPDPAAITAAAQAVEQLAVPRAIFESLHPGPFSCGPVLGSRGEPVGAIALAAYHGGQPIPEPTLAHGHLRVVLDLLSVVLERARVLARNERLEAELAAARATIERDARPKAVGELASWIAHDLNHLCGIATLASSVGARSAADAVEMLPAIERANRAMGDLVARLQRAGRPSSEDEDGANLPQIVDDLLVLFKPALREHAIEVLAHVPDELRVRCDAVLVHQVVLNLLLNARDALVAMPPERRVIKLQAREDGDVVRLAVVDRGPGFTPEVLARLFEPYVTTKADGHLGLGLSAVRGSLASAGATLEARNAPDGGAELEVTWIAAPRVVSVPAPVPPAERAERAVRDRADEPVQRGRILAIDDDLDLLYLIRAFLEPHGHPVSTVSSSAEAVELARSQAFDLVLCDIAMPKLSGLEVCRSFREAGYRGMFVLMTGWDSDRLSIDARAAACDRVLKKPFGAEIVQVIDGLLRRAR